MDFQTQQSTTSQSAAGGASASMAQANAAAQHQAVLASGAGGTGAGSSGLNYMSPYIRQDFISQETMIDIMPKFELGRIQFLNSKYGPFSPNYPVSVPLWLALFLRETNTCSIRPPREMTVDFLMQALQFEAENDLQFLPLPFHFFSLVRQILRYAASDIPDAAVVHRLVDELEQRRISKITKNINVLQNGGPESLTPSAFTLQLTSSEWLVVKATILRVMNDAVELKARAEQRIHRPADLQQQRQQQSRGYQQPEYYQVTTMTGGSSSSLAGGDSQTATGGDDNSSFYSFSQDQQRQHQHQQSSASNSTRTRRSLRS